MSLKLRAVDRLKLYSAIVDQILAGIESGELRPGEPLPAERTLASELNVSRSSVREAIRVLEHAGVLDVRTGSGTYVADAGTLRGSALRAQAALVGEQSPLDVLVARRALEPTCCRLAASEGRAKEITELKRVLARHAALLEADEDPAEADLSFHLGIATTSHNPVLATLLERLVEIMTGGMWREWHHEDRFRPETAQGFLEDHRRILTAIERHQPEAAAKAMERHLDAVESGVTASIV